MKKLGTPLFGALVLILAPSACAYNDCQVTAPRQAVVDAAGAQKVRVEAKAGSLQIVGEEGLTEVRVTGEACAPNQSSLEKVQLHAERVGDEVRVVVDIPERWGERGALDLELRVPADLAVDVEDGSGEIDVDGVAALRVVDGSGSIDVRQVAGSVVLEDGSGSIEVIDVGGDVTVERDGSGGIAIRAVDRNVLIRQDGSGSIEVEDVGGDFTVEEDGSGRITHSGVRGTVQIP